jgi:hypothetical protein
VRVVCCAGEAAGPAADWLQSAFFKVTSADTSANPNLQRRMLRGRGGLRAVYAGFLGWDLFDVWGFDLEVRKSASFPV